MRPIKELKNEIELKKGKIENYATELSDDHIKAFVKIPKNENYVYVGTKILLDVLIGIKKMGFENVYLHTLKVKESKGLPHTLLVVGGKNSGIAVATCDEKLVDFGK